MDDSLASDIEAAVRAVSSALHLVVTGAVRDAVLESKAQALQTPPANSTSEIDPTCKLFNGEQVAELLGVSRRHLHTLTKSGRLPSVRIGTSIRYRQTTLAKWLADQEATDVRSVGQKSSKNARKTSGKTPALSANHSIKNSKANLKSAPSAPPPKRSDRRQLPKTRPQQSNQKIERFVSRLENLANSLEVDYESLPKMTNGDIRRIADVDIPTLHGWQYREQELPPAALDNLIRWLKSFAE